MQRSTAQQASKIDVKEIAKALKDAEAKAKPIRRRLSVHTPAGGRSETWVQVKHEVDPHATLMDKFKDLPSGMVQFSRILVAIYEPPIVEKTQGGLYLAKAIQDEDIQEHRNQGKVGIVVAMGERAYVDDDTIKFNGIKVEVGDWVWFRPSDGMPCDVREHMCRLFDSERYIIGKLPHPDMVA